MITLTEVEKLGRVHAVEPVVLSVYLNVPRADAELPGRVDDLVTEAERIAGRPARLREEDRRSVREAAVLAGRGRAGQRLAVFACAEADGGLTADCCPDSGLLIHGREVRS